MVMANMDPVAIPADFELNMKTEERSRESIKFEEDLMKALQASRGGFERSMSTDENQTSPSAASAAELEAR